MFVCDSYANMQKLQPPSALALQSVRTSQVRIRTSDGQCVGSKGDVLRLALRRTRQGGSVALGEEALHHGGELGGALFLRGVTGVEELEA